MANKVSYINNLEVLSIVQNNIKLYGGYDKYVANEFVNDILGRLNIDYSEIDFTPTTDSVDHIYTYDLFEYSILDKKEDTLVLLVLENYYWFDYYKDNDKIEIIKELPKVYDKNHPYYADDNPLNINDKFIYNNDLYIVDEYLYHDMSIVASKVHSVIEISPKDLTYDSCNGAYYFSFEDYQERDELDG